MNAPLPNPAPSIQKVDPRRLPEAERQAVYQAAKGLYDCLGVLVRPPAVPTRR